MAELNNAINLIKSTAITTLGASGTLTVSDANITANSIILAFGCGNGTFTPALGILTAVLAPTTGFTITSSVGAADNGNGVTYVVISY